MLKKYLFSYRGVSLGVECGELDFDSVTEHLCLPIWEISEDSTAASWFSLVRDLTGEPKIVGPQDEESRSTRANFLEDLERRIHFYLANHCRDVVFVHAGVVAWKGRAIVLPARSYSGKSTLVVELLKCGAQYLSDEYAVVDERGLIHPFPRPLSLRARGGGNRRLRPDDPAIGSADWLEPIPLAAVLISHYVPGANWEPEITSPAKAVMELFSNSVSARAQPRFALSCLSEAMGRAVCWESPRGEAVDTAGLILEAVARIVQGDEKDSR